MKRTVALVVALLMALSVVPAMAFAAPADASRHDGADHDPVNYYVTDINYAAVTSVEDGGTGLASATSGRYFYVGISEGSGLYASQFLVDYPEAFVSITGASNSWSGGLISQINATWDDEEPWSDTLNVVYNYPYEGQTGGVPVGEAGNMYINGGTYETSYEFMGTQMGGYLARFTLRLDKTPYESDCEQDANGYYLPMPLLINEFEYAIVKDNGNYGASDNYAQPEYADWLSSTDGKIYVTPKADPEQPGEHTPVNYYVTDIDYSAVTAVDQGGTGLASATSGRYFYIGISENSGLYASQFLIDYPEEFVSITGASNSWSGGLIAQINATWDDEEPWSDTLNVVYNYPYEGQTGGVPVGEAGNMYINGGTYETSYEFMGTQMGGLLARFTLRLDKAPTFDDVMQDENGYYLPNPLFINEFEYAIIKDNGNYGASENYAQPEYASWLSSTDGKIYVTPIEVEEPTEVPTEEPTPVPTEEPTPVPTEVPTYTVYFYVDGEEYTTVTYAYGETYDMPVYTPATGYTFSGWTQGEDGNYYGTTAAIDYTVTYYVDGVEYATQTYHYGDAVVAPEYEVATGYEFSGWTVPATMPAENIALYATTTQLNYTVTYTVNGEFYAEQTYHYGDAIVAPEYDVPAGWTFTGWTVPATMPAENITVDATLSEVPVYTVTYTVNGEVYTTQTYYEGDAIVVPEYDVPDGYTFSGWTVPATMPAENITVDATLEVHVWTLTIRYQYADDQIIGEETYQLAYGTEYSYDVPEIEGYTAYPTVVSGTMPDEDKLEVVVYSQVIMYTVTFQFVDEVYYENGQIVTVADPITVTLPAGSSVTGYNYPVVEGYTYESEGMPIEYIVSGNNTVLVYYNPNTYNLTIHYVFEDGTEAAADYVDQILYNRPYEVESPVVTGYTPDHAIVDGTMPAEDVVVTVIYTVNEHNVVIHYVDEQGNELYPDYEGVVNYGEDFAVTSPTTIPNYYPDVEVVEGTMGDEDLEYTVVYTYVAPYEPVPPTVAGTAAEIRARATNDSLKDLRFIMTVTFNDSYVTYGGVNYGPTTEYYKIIKFWTVLSTGSASVTVNGTNIYEMNDDTFTYTAVLKGVKEASFDTVITATPYLTYTMGGVSTTVEGPAISSSVNEALNK